MKTLSVRQLSIGIVVISLTLSAACDGGSPTEEVSDPPSSTELRLTNAQLTDALKAVSDFQRKLIEDGVLTFEEYEQATLAAIGCFKDAGFTIGPGSGPEVPEGTAGPRLTKRGKYTYNPISPPNYSFETFSAIVTDCTVKYTATIDFLWAIKAAPAEQEVQAARGAIASCLRNQGAEVPEHPSSVELARLAYPPDGKPHPGQGPQSTYLLCSEPVAEEFDLPGFIG